MMEVSFLRTRKHPGEKERKSDPNGFYRQEWRHEKFVVEVNGGVLWTLLEAHSDFSEIVREVMEE